ncbi:MAG: threonine--tRNA ligase, partial [Clostridiaceae bacterium]
LYKISGHWDHYRAGMFHMGDLSDESTVMSLRPMTCPFQFTIYNSDQHSYRELPIRMAETSTLFRNESSGEMHGLIRVRQFTISEGHLIVRPDQVEEEFKGVMELQQYILGVLGLDEGISYRFSMGDRDDKEKYIDNPQAWDDTEGQMKRILDSMPIEYTSAKGEAAFYGPKLDIQYKNVHGKEDTIITNQIDFALPERFDMYFIDKDGQKKRPYVLHRTSIGCYERTLAMLIEKYAGAFPLWLAPVQVKLLPISEKYHDYVEKLEKALKNKGVRVEADYRGEKIGYKIREARIDRAPYMLIIGEQEEKNGSVAVRSRQKGDEGQADFNEFLNRVVKEIDEKYNYHKFMEIEESSEA